MKKLIILMVLVVSAFTANAQMAAGSYGPYEFVANYDHNGNRMEIKGFPTINLKVITTSFYGIVQSSCVYTYDYFGTMQMSNWFEYKGIYNGWYVYYFGGLQLLISLDEDTIRVTNPYGGYGEYEK